MRTKTITAWLAVLTLALVLLSSCESGGNYRLLDYRFGVGAEWNGFFEPGPWRNRPHSSSYPPELDEPIAGPSPAMGRPDIGGRDLDGGDLGGFD